jgi:hypothetical protein
MYVNVQLTVFGNRVLRGEVTGEWRKLHNQELHDLYPPSTLVRVMKSRKMGWAGYVAHGEERGVFRVLVGKPEGKRPLGRPRHRWEDNIKVDLQEWDVGVWTGSIWLRIETGERHL